jgi:hypothetical protein
MSSSGEGHRSSRIWRASRWIVAGLLVYLVVGNALHHWVFRPPPPDAVTFPRSFAACLAQLYPRLDEAGGISLSLLLQMSVIDPICDTHLAGVPGPVLATMKAFLAPAARLLGYRSYDPGLALHPPPS